MKGKFTTIKKAIPAAMIVVGSMGLASNASASAYGVAYNNIFNLFVSSTDDNGAGGPFFVGLDDFDSFNATASSAATRGAFGGSGSGDANSGNAGGAVDAAISYGTGSSFVGLGPTNNGMTVQGQNGDYSYGDAEIGQTAIEQASAGAPITATGDLTQAWGIAEGFVPASGLATANTVNSSETGFDTSFTVDSDAIFSFAFDADPYLEVALSGDAIGGSANAAIELTFTITDNSTGFPVFIWSPDGEAGGIFNGTETLDELNLNNSRDVTVGGASAIFDGNGNGAPSGDRAPGSFASFAAQTMVLAPGSYSLSLDLVTLINITSDVPAPGVLALMGLGLAGLGFSRRRKAS